MEPLTITYTMDGVEYTEELGEYTYAEFAEIVTNNNGIVTS